MAYVVYLPRTKHMDTTESRTVGDSNRIIRTLSLDFTFILCGEKVLGVRNGARNATAVPDAPWQRRPRDREELASRVSLTPLVAATNSGDWLTR
jgi:hypothetical protein